MRYINRESNRQRPKPESKQEKNQKRVFNEIAFRELTLNIRGESPEDVAQIKAEILQIRGY